MDRNHQVLPIDLAHSVLHSEHGSADQQQSEIMIAMLGHRPMLKGAFELLRVHSASHPGGTRVNRSEHRLDTIICLCLSEVPIEAFRVSLLFAVCETTFPWCWLNMPLRHWYAPFLMLH